MPRLAAAQRVPRPPAQVGERVATIKFEAILGNVIQRKDAPAWGPNAQFRYPLNGTGMIWDKVHAPP